MERLTWKSLVVSALRNRQVLEANAFAEDRQQERILEIGRIEAQIELVNRYESAHELLKAIDRLRSRVAYELQTSDEAGDGVPPWSTEAVGIRPVLRPPGGQGRRRTRREGKTEPEENRRAA